MLVKKIYLNIKLLAGQNGVVVYESFYFVTLLNIVGYE